MACILYQFFQDIWMFSMPTQLVQYIRSRADFLLGGILSIALA